MIGEIGNHLWQSSLFVVAAALVAIALRKNRAHIRYWVWLAASLKFLVPFSLLIGIGSYFASIQVVKSIPLESPSFTVAQFAQPFSSIQPLPVTPARPEPINWPPILFLGVWLAVYGLSSR